MPRALLPISLLLAAIAIAHAAPDEPAGAVPEPDSTFEGVWVGDIVAPNTREQLGLAFMRTERGLLVSVHFPRMFLYSVNFGSAQISDGVFRLPPLNLVVAREGDRLSGTFGPARLPLELRRGRSFSAPPPEPEFPAAPEPAWTRSLGAGAWATPATFAGIVYAATVDGQVHAVNGSDGAPLWTWQGAHPLHGAPLATEDAVYLIDDDAGLVALARADGTLRWRAPLHDTAFAPKPAPNATFNHRAPSPVIDAKGVLYAGSTDGGLYAVRARNGRTLWRHAAGAAIYAPVTLQGDELAAGCFDGSVFVLNRRSRRESLRVRLGGPVVSAPAFAGGHLVVGARDCLLYGVTRSGGIGWRNAYWFSWVESPAHVADGIVYVGGSDYRRVSAIDPATGREFWSTDVHGLSWGTPIVTRETVFAATAGQNIDGTVIRHTGGIAALDRATGAVKWRYVAPVAAGADFTGFAGSLQLVGDLLVGASVDGTLIAFPIDR